MWDFSVSRGLAMMARTWPFIAFRMLVYFGIAVAYVVTTGIGAGLGWGIGAIGSDDFQASATMWGGIFGFGITAGILYLMREYILYVVKAGHIAVLMELIEGRDIPDGRSQIEHATTIVKSRFAETNVLFALDQLIKGVLRTIIGIVRGFLSLLPIPAVQQATGVISAFLRIAIGLVDEMILGHSMRSRAENPWSSAQKALVLYGQNYKVMLRNAAWLTAITYGLSFVVFLIMLAPAGALVYLIPGAWSAGGLIFAILFAWAVKAALIEPFAIACMMQVFFRTIEGQTPDPVWEERLGQASDKFREMGKRAMDWVGARRGVRMPDGPAPQRQEM